MANTALRRFQITRFQFRRDRVIGDSQIRVENANIFALELIDASGRIGLGFHCTHQPLPDEEEIARIFATEVWPTIDGREAGAIAIEVTKPRGGSSPNTIPPFDEVIQQACWDLLAKSLDLPLWKLFGAKRDSVRIYASGLDFHLSDAEFVSFFERALSLGYSAFKIKVGHPDLEFDLHRLELLRSVIGSGKPVMIDANEAWTSAEALVALAAFAKAGHSIYWAEDPVPRDDIDGLLRLRAARLTRINSGEYLNVSGKRRLIEAHACDMINVHGRFSDVMRTGWLAGEANIEVTLGNTMFEVGVNSALALPGVDWLEYSFHNYEHLIEAPFPIRNGRMYGSSAPGHGLTLSEEARKHHRRPKLLAEAEIETGPAWSFVHGA
jgi:L-alanine-DL-glutamate epimerase-like enolase superfamily enzyme